MTRTIIPAGVALIRDFEKLSLKAYRCPAGVLTIGYGHTGKDVIEGMEINRAQADALLRADVAVFSRSVDRLLKAPATDHQFAAMVSLAFNIGTGSFAKSSVLRLHNEGKEAAAAAAFSLWNKATAADGVKRELKGLTRRRAAEAELYLTPTEESEADDPQRARAADVEPAEKGGMKTAATIGGGIVVASSVMREVISGVSGVWDTLNESIGDPRLVTGFFTALVIAAVVWGVMEWRKARREGRA